MLSLLIAALIIFPTALGNGGFENVFNFDVLGWYALLYIVSVIIIRILLTFLPSIGYMALAVLAIVSYYAGASFQYSVNGMERYVVTTHTPLVQVEMLRQNGVKNGAVRVTNMGDDILREVYLVCHAAYDNGQVIERTFTRGIGAIRMFKGNKVEFQAVDRSDQTRFSMNPNTIACAVDTAQFSANPAKDFSVTAMYDDNTLRNKFDVTNNGAYSVRDIQVTCTNMLGRQVEVPALPTYKVDVVNRTVVKPGETVRYTAAGVNSEMTNCQVSNAIRM